MRKLIIHAGSHKTGTSSIQRCLWLNKDKLSEQNWSFFDVPCQGKNSRNGNGSSWVVFRGAGLEIRTGIYKTLAVSLAKMPTDNVIFSAEALSWINSLEQVRNFKKKLDTHFDEISIIFYIRRQDKLAISHKQQGSKVRGRLAKLFYGDEICPLPAYKPYFSNYLDYNQRLSKWADVFGDDQMVIRIFERELLPGQDVVTDFINSVNLLLQPEVIRRNKSLGKVETIIGQILAKNKVPSKVHQDIIRQIKKNANIVNTAKYLPSRDEAYDFYKHFRQSNKLLNDRFNISDQDYLFDENFDMYPVVGNSKPTFDEAMHIITAVLEARILT